MTEGDRERFLAEARKEAEELWALTAELEARLEAREGVQRPRGSPKKIPLSKSFVAWLYEREGIEGPPDVIAFVDCLDPLPRNGEDAACHDCQT